ncbi:hypothetical protein HOY80DRAFT_1001270 [Tuber brumale]|nr:hypothetical protein HOY80DRAFT_1001270 [Tuber brumale]
MLQSHHCWKCGKAANASYHPKHAFSPRSGCRACLNPRDLATEQEPVAEKVTKEIDVLPEEWVGSEEQTRRWKLIEKQKAEKAWEKQKEVPPKKGVGKDGARYVVKRRRRRQKL